MNAVAYLGILGGSAIRLDEFDKRSTPSLEAVRYVAHVTVSRNRHILDTLFEDTKGLVLLLVSCDAKDAFSELARDIRRVRSFLPLPSTPRPQGVRWNKMGHFLASTQR